MYCILLSFVYIFAKQNIIMKKINLLLLGIILSFSLLAGNDNSEKIYNELKGNSDSFSMSLSKDMIDFFDLDIDVNGKEKLIKGDFSSGKMMVINEKRSGEKAKDMFIKAGYELIDFEEDQDDDGEVYLLVSRKGKLIKEAHFVVVEDEKMILLSIFGEMRVSSKN